MNTTIAQYSTMSAGAVQVGMIIKVLDQIFTIKLSFTKNKRMQNNQSPTQSEDSLSLCNIPLIIQGADSNGNILMYKRCNLLGKVTIRN